jgi:hypothetical protein
MIRPIAASSPKIKDVISGGRHQVPDEECSGTHGKAKARMFGPTASAMYCFPSTV